MWGQTTLSKFDVTREFGRGWVEPVREDPRRVVGSACTGNSVVVTRVHVGNPSLFGLLVLEVAALLVHLHEIVQVLILLGHVGIDHELALVSIDLLDAPFREGYDFVLNRQPVKDLQHEK